MPITTLSSREFDQDANRARKAADEGPVFITERGRPTHVLLKIEDFRRLVGGRRKITDILALPDAENIAFDPPRARVGIRPTDFS